MTTVFWILGLLCLIGFVLSLAARPRSGGGMFLFITVGILTWLSLHFGLSLWWTLPIYVIAAVAFGSLWRTSDKRRGNQIAATLSVLALLVGAIGAYVVGYQDGAEAGGKAAAVAAMDKPAATQQFKGSMVKDSNGNMVAVPDGTGTAAGRDNSWKQDFANNESSDCLVGGVKGATTEQQRDELLNKLRHNAFCLSVVATAAELPAMKNHGVNDIGWLVSPAENGTVQYMSREGRSLHGDLVKFYESAKLSQTTAAAAGTNTGRNEAGNFQSAGISGTPESRKALTATAPNGAEVTVLLRCGNVAFAPGAQVLPSGHTDSLPPRPQKTPPTGGGPAPTPSKPGVPVPPGPKPPVSTQPSTPVVPPTTVTTVTTPPTQPPTTVTTPPTSLPKETSVAPENQGNAPMPPNKVTADPSPSAPAVDESLAPTTVPIPDPPVVPTQPREIEPGPIEGGATPDNPVTGAPSVDTCEVCGPAVGASVEAPAAAVPVQGSPAESNSTASVSGAMPQASEPVVSDDSTSVDTTSVVEKALTKDDDNGAAVAALAVIVLSMGFGSLFVRRSKVTA